MTDESEGQPVLKVLFSTVKTWPERPCVHDAVKLKRDEKEGSGALKRKAKDGHSQLCTSGLSFASAQRTRVLRTVMGRRFEASQPALRAGL